METAIIGGGAMGTASASHLAGRGVNVTLFEQFACGHDLGSSHGNSRIIRFAYMEHPDYVPLVRRAHELWRTLEKDSGESLLTTTGIVEMGSPESGLLRGTLLSCDTHGIPHERLSARKLMKRFPQFRCPSWMEAVYQKDAGILAPERCILTYRRCAKGKGAVIRENEPVLALKRGRSGGWRIETRGGVYEARKVILAAGAWSSRFLKDLDLPLVVARKTLAYYMPKVRSKFELGSFPLFMAEIPGFHFYGFPIFESGGFKIADHLGGEIADPDHIDRNFNPEDGRNLRAFLDAYIPEASGEFLYGKVCMYTLTPDHDFILDFHPKYSDLLIAAGFSGHGFKFASVVGEIMADLATKGTTRHSISRFSIKRF